MFLSYDYFQLPLSSIVVVNLDGYTKGARNEIFAARPCPLQVSLMGFAGTLGAGKSTSYYLRRWRLSTADLLLQGGAITWSPTRSSVPLRLARRSAGEQC